MGVACKQALLFGRAKGVLPECESERRSSRVLARLAQIGDLARRLAWGKIIQLACRQDILLHLSYKRQNIPEDKCGNFICNYAANESMLDLFITSERGSTKSKVHVWQRLKIFCHASDSNKNLKFDGVTVVVQFYSWVNSNFLLFQNHYNTLSYPKTKENKI